MYYGTGDFLKVTFESFEMIKYYFLPLELSYI